MNFLLLKLEVEEQEAEEDWRLKSRRKKRIGCVCVI